MQQNIIILHLSLIDGVGPATINTIIRNKPGNCAWRDIYTFGAQRWRELGIFTSIAQKLCAGLSDSKIVEEELLRLKKHDISLTTILDDDYPQLLRHINVPPAILYYKGAPFLQHEKMVAVVGSRKADNYGQQVIESLIPSFIAHNWSIVSGGALGADSMAHAATINAGGKTIVILGSGLLHPYPHSNKSLFDEIIKSGGTLVSPFSLTTTARPGNFPARNRIIAGLSKGCIVVQAAKKSGASITARYALEQGRDVFAVPGHIDNILSAGCHALIQEGAKLITNAADVLQEFGEEIRTEIEPVVVPEKTRQLAMSLSPKPQTINRPQKINKPKKNVYAQDTIQGKILNSCAQPANVDDLVLAFDLQLSELQSILFDLQLEGLVQQNIAGQWVLI